MTDNEIIQAMNYCCGNIEKDGECKEDMCYQATLPEDRGGDTRWCRQWLMKDALDLINRQKVRVQELEIELQATRNAANRFKSDVERLENENKILSINADTAFQDGLNKAQDLYAEQVKEEVKAELELATKVSVDGGTIVTSPSSDPDYPGINIEFIPNNDNTIWKDAISYPRVLMEKPYDGVIRVLVWGDSNNEEYTKNFEWHE